MKLKLAEEAGDERQARKFRSSTDGPKAAEHLTDLKARVQETQDKVKYSNPLSSRDFSRGSLPVKICNSKLNWQNWPAGPVVSFEIFCSEILSLLCTSCRNKLIYRLDSSD